MEIFGALGVFVELIKICFFSSLAGARKGNLHNIIGKHVKSNTKICTNEWKGYLGPENKYLQHFTICHKKHFVDPKNDEIHTQNIENL